MDKYIEIKGNLITLALNGEFDVITHGCNCQSAMKSGIAPLMAKHFYCDKYKMELLGVDINKLGNIDYETIVLGQNATWRLNEYKNNKNEKEIIVVNSYSQFDTKDYKTKVNLDYEALTLCFRKINNLFSGKKIGLPGLIGCGLAGGDENRVKDIVKKELKNCFVTICYLK
jgi:O-acetyl-ADP-ribose deacetylase (regulator of RNase III)